jgi:uncharacterized phosphosugar-binding protein
VVALTLRKRSEAMAARGGASVKLSSVADLVPGTHAPLGDAAVDIDGDVKVGGVSTVMNRCFQTIVVATPKLSAERGLPPPVFKSSNVDGSDEWHADQLKRL